jgi:hypothetical protein
MPIEVNQSNKVRINSPCFFSYSDCDHLRKAIKGSEIDENIIIDILGNRTADQRLKIRDKYKTMSGRVRDKKRKLYFTINSFFRFRISMWI